MSKKTGSGKVSRTRSHLAECQAKQLQFFKVGHGEPLINFKHECDIVSAGVYKNCFSLLPCSRGRHQRMVYKSPYISRAQFGADAKIRKPQGF